MNQEERSLLGSSSSYREENEDVESSSSSSQSSTNRFHLFVLIAVGSAVGLMLIASKSGLSSRTEMLRQSPTKRLQLVKTGQLMYSSLKDDEVLDLFTDFKKTFGKDYSSKEEEERYGHFVKFLKNVDARNTKEQKKGGTAVHGVTMFSDLSDAEFEEGYLGYVAPEEPEEVNTLVAVVEPYAGKKTNVDWTGKYATDVLDQGYCGSCWAFSATQQIHSDAIRAGLLKYQEILSTQQMVSCDTESNGATDNANFGCQGGNTETAYMYARSSGGLSTMAQYPYSSYEGQTEACVTDNIKNVVNVENWYTVRGEDQMMDYVMSTGPLSGNNNTSILFLFFETNSTITEPY